MSDFASESMEDILLLSNRSYSAGDRFMMCCRPSYQIRKVKNKAAILVLVWNHLVLSVFYYLTLYPHVFHSTWHVYSIMWGLSLPIAGCLADVCCGLYKNHTLEYLDHVDSLSTGSSKLCTVTICDKLLIYYLCNSCVIYYHMYCIWRLPSQYCSLWN